MKKILIIVAVLFTFLMPATSVFAALGGQYYIDDLNMKIFVPYNWDVLTRDTTEDDEDVGLYGYGTTDVLFSEFVDVNQYMEIYNDDGRIELYSYYDYFSKEVWNFADNADTYTEDYINKLKDKNAITDNMIYSSYEVYDNGKYIFIKSIAKMDDRNVIEYDTILNGRYVYCWLITDEPLTQENTQEFEKMIDSILVYEDENFLEDDKTEENLLMIASILAVVFVVLLILVLINSSKRKKILKSMPEEYVAALQTKQQPVKQEAKKPQQINENKDYEPKEKEIKRYTSIYCDYCKKAIPSDSVFCPICGEKIK